MELRAFKHKRGREYYVARENKEHYACWDYEEYKWVHGFCATWEEVEKDYGAREISWLELLVATGTSKKEAIRIWHQWKSSKD
jgi:hypothetical protein